MSNAVTPGPLRRPTPDEPGRSPWWQSTVVYQIYPRSFRDTTGDGVGDLAGIIAGLDHLRWLGVGALWLSPVYRSPMADFGYDIADHCDIDPLFGDLGDLDRLIDEAHERNIRVVLDFVPNHTSDTHPWFVASRSSRHNPMRDWYVWRDPAPGGGPPNNWVAAWGGGPAWTFDEATGQYYLHCFLDRQPDLDWSNPKVVAAMHDVVRFWLDRGVDGFRIDVVHLIGKDPLLGDDDPDLIPLPHSVLNHRCETHPLLRDLRSLVDSYDHDPVMVGEVFLLDTAMMAEYYGAGDELHLAFNFPPLFSPWSARRWRAHIADTERFLGERGAWPTWALSNHDVPRHATRYAAPDADPLDDAVAASAAVLLFGLRGTPFVYAGEELGLRDAVVGEDVVVDPGGRDGCRAPLPWEPDGGHGWAGDDPWLPWPPDCDRRNAVTMRNNPSSLANLYRRLVALRADRQSLALGSLTLIDSDPDVVAFTRHHPDDPAGSLAVVVNFSADPVSMPELPFSAGAHIVLSSGLNGQPSPVPAALDPNEAVIIAAGNPPSGT